MPGGARLDARLLSARAAGRRNTRQRLADDAVGDERCDIRGRDPGRDYLDQVHPGVERMLVSARTGEGVQAWRDWLLGVAARETALA